MTLNLVDRLRAAAEGEERAYFGDVSLLLKEAADEINRLKAELDAYKWNPIETCPKDGTEILALCKFEGDQDPLRIVLSFEVDKNPTWPWRDWDCQGIYKDVPVSWMTLPKPPKA